MIGKKFHDKSQNILKKIVSLMKLGHKPNSREVQNIICAHYEHAKQFHHMSLKVYKAMAKLYRLHPSIESNLRCMTLTCLSIYLRQWRFINYE